MELLGTSLWQAATEEYESMTGALYFPLPSVAHHHWASQVPCRQLNTT